MNIIKVGHFEQDGGLINLPIGFVPDHIRLIDFHTDTNIEINEWFRRMEQDQGTGKQEGFSILEGITANLADAGGITAYNTGAQSPANGTGAGQLAEWVASTSYTARLTCDSSEGAIFLSKIILGVPRSIRSSCRCPSSKTSAFFTSGGM